MCCTKLQHKLHKLHKQHKAQEAAAASAEDHMSPTLWKQVNSPELQLSASRGWSLAAILFLLSAAGLLSVLKEALQ